MLFAYTLQNYVRLWFKEFLNLLQMFLISPTQMKKNLAVLWPRLDQGK